MKTYTVTQIANIANNNDTVEIQKARDLAYRLGNLRKDLWNLLVAFKRGELRPTKY